MTITVSSVRTDTTLPTLVMLSALWRRARRLHDDRADRLQSWHRNRGRGIKQLEKQLPADGYMNTVTPTVAHPDRQHDQWEGHPLTLQGSLNEGDVRKGEFTMSKFLDQNRWFTEYGKVYNAKQFILNMSTTHAEDLCNFASYDAYLTGSNKIFYLHEHFKSKVWKDVETSGFAHDSTFQIPYRPTSQLKLIHLTRMVNVTAAQHARYRGTTALSLILSSGLAATLVLFCPPTISSSLGPRMMRSTRFGVEMPHFYRTTPCFQSFGTMVLHVNASAPAMSSDSLLLTLSLSGLKFCHVMSGKSTTALSAALLAHTQSSRRSVAKNLMRVLLSSRLILRSAITVFGLCSSLWFHSLRRT